ncbi:MAG: AsnC family protein [Methanosaeta sp. PtaB.Bin039]|nr:MAG: AsnC family protein [Methanosaeta sp. PtaB.Bin039]OPY44500.1 MAG: AsnC family protein [Methanosaeta sp. PtaU1.Bin028]HOT07836.1 Lrp/AsnC ligand binding domain-containing protein [Methanotrichaceae archaeon]HQF15904.1 Lrp/AsnC ligand binding domain-containing protein [Methanotrichaceae archaeon]HQI90748.1 Lrp/AsnC ligand binding domain-containing protein [Methanotrichaceae archaeon]
MTAGPRDEGFSVGMGLRVMKGFVMINVEPGSEKSVHDALTLIKGVREVVAVYGEHDFIAITDVQDISDLNLAVLAVREIPGVTNTRTILGMELKF